MPHNSAASSRMNWRHHPSPRANLNGLVRFAERRNLVSARVPSHFNWPLPLLYCHGGKKGALLCYYAFICFHFRRVKWSGSRLIEAQNASLLDAQVTQCKVRSFWNSTNSSFTFELCNFRRISSSRKHLPRFRAYGRHRIKGSNPANMDFDSLILPSYFTRVKLKLVISTRCMCMCVCLFVCVCVFVCSRAEITDIFTKGCKNVTPVWDAPSAAQIAWVE